MAGAYALDFGAVVALAHLAGPPSTEVAALLEIALPIAESALLRGLKTEDGGSHGVQGEA
jgi:hypothetical protein